MKTTLTHYYFDISSPTEKEAYSELTAKLKKTNGKCFRVLPNPSRELHPEGDVTLDVSNINNIWNNQWNTACGFRVFDWYEGVYPNRDIKRGYYLTITPEMKSLRGNLLRCGYCGHTTTDTSQKFCTACIGSTYIREDYLHLLRMKPLTTKRRKTLTPDELSHLTTEFNKAKVKAVHSEYSAEEQARQYEKEEKLFREAVEKAEYRLTGFNFLLENNISQENCIYYDHAGVFCFGWRHPLPDASADYLEDLLENFPAKYEIKRHSGA